MQRRFYSRGYSILAALVFAAILGGVAAGVNYLSPASSNPLAMSASTAVPLPQPKPQELQNEQACEKAKKEAADGKTERSVSDDESAKDDCVGAVFDQSKVQKGESDPKKNPKNYKCVGRSARVSIKESTINDKSYPDPNIQTPGLCKVTACNPEDMTSGKEMKCFSTTLTSLDKNKINTGNWEPEAIQEVKGTPEKLGFDPDTGEPLDDVSQDAINKAFLKDDRDEIDQIDTENAQIDEKLKQLNEDEGCAMTPGVCDAERQQLEEQKKANEQRQKELQERVAELEKAETGGLDPKNTPAPDPANIDTIDVKCQGGKCTAEAKNDAEMKALEHKDNGFKCTPTETGAYCEKAMGSTTKKPPGKTDTFPTPVPKPDPRKDPPKDPPSGPGGSQDTGGKPGGGSPGGGNPMSALGNLLQGLAKGLTGAGQGGKCPSDPNAYQQQQQQYQMQMQQYNQQLQQYNYQQQIAAYNGYPPPVPPTAPVPCTPDSTSNTCPTAPPQPPASQCPNGTWKPSTTQQSNGRQCTSSWQCSPVATTPPAAELSCEPKVIDVGMSVAISFSCTNATGSTGNGFSTGNATSGATTTVIANPPAGARKANFAVTCRNQNLTARAECSVQLARPTISIVARPKSVPVGATSTVAWVTTGMESCLVSSAQLPEFTAENATSSRVNGTASTPPLEQDTEFLLTCETVGGNTKTATTSVTIATTSIVAVAVSSEIDGREDVRHGNTALITWSAPQAPADSSMSLWLLDMRTGNSVGLIAGQLAATGGTYRWSIPAASSACPADTPFVCAADIIAGRYYAIEAALYTPPNAFLGGFPPANPIYPDYIGLEYSTPFRVTN